ncbi:hypothetical protein [Aminipila sp.]|uniref:hypothetical protein n=1 Tax=Aminipila sp. TaxID=2060095 RepID=UPI00289C58BE|nr:hypothetical protein [Aminipila sp.]
MPIQFKKFIGIILIVLIVGVTIRIVPIAKDKWGKLTPVMGGTIHSLVVVDSSSKKEAVKQSEDQDDNERFRRPSKQITLNNEFSFRYFQKDNDKPPLITTAFETSENLVKAYFGILKSAANMKDYLGGCGTIGNSLQPYPYAYELYSNSTQKDMPLSQFVDSFSGIGQINLLKLYPAYVPSGTPDNIGYYMFEIETITGPSEKDEKSYNRGGSYFAYYYGLITTEYDPNYGWKIKEINYLPEDFLCAPDHGWSYSAEYLVPIVYQDWYHLIDNIDRIEQDGDIVSVYASGPDKQYKFDFVRLTNGYDILMHENLWNNGRWEEINILSKQDQGLKLSSLNPNLR